MTLTKARTLQYIGILFALGLIAAGYWYWSARAGVKTNTSVSQPQGTGRLDSGLAFYMKLDEITGSTAADASTNGLNGTLYNMENGDWTTGQIGNSLSFDGVDETIEITNASASPIDISLGDRVTTAFWYKANQPNGTTGKLHDRNGGGCEHHSFNVTGGASTDTLGFYYRGGDCSGIDNYQISGVSKNTWHHIASTYDTVTGEFVAYVDGTQRTSGTAIPTANISGASSALYIGGAGGQHLNGFVDEFRIYKRVLSVDEVGQLYRLTTPTGVDTSLKGYWSFDGQDISGTSAYDRSGAGNTGTLTSGPTSARGISGQALHFDGATNYVDVGNPPQLQFTGDISLSAWIKPDILSDYLFFLGKYYGITDEGYDIGIMADGRVVATFRDANGQPDGFSAAGLVTANVWQYITVTQSLSDCAVRIYKNAVLATTLTNQPCFNNIGNSFIIGGRDQNGSFPGSVDEVRVHNRVLTQSEIQSLYEAAAPDKTNTAISQVEGTGRLDSGLALYLPLDENTGTIASDASTNGKAGTLTNGPTWTSSGHIGSGVEFDGVDDYISVPDSDDSKYTGALTLCAWARIDTGGVYRGFMSKNDASNSPFEFRAGSAATPNVELVRANTDYVVYIGPEVTLGAWKHYCVVAPPLMQDQATFYIDGVGSTVNVAYGTGTGTATGSGASITVGNRADNTIRMDGGMDEVRIYSRMLSADEISQLYRLTAPTGVDRTLKGYWSFNGQDISGTIAADRSGAGNKGTLGGGPATARGIAGQALSFDGSDDSLVASDADSLDADATSAKTGLADFSYGGLFKTSATSTQRIISKRAGGGAPFRGYEMAIQSSGQVMCTLDDNTTSYLEIDTVGSFNDGNWHSAWCIIDRGAGTLKLLIDGKNVQTTVASGSNTLGSYGALANTSDFYIGRYSVAGTEYFQGELDEMRVYNRALTLAEVQTLYAAVMPDKTNSSLSTPQGTGRLDSGLAGYWKLDENTGTSAADASTNGNTGTLTNGPTWTTGQIGSAVNLDGSNDYISVPNSPALDITTNAITFGAWVYPTVSNVYQLVAGKLTDTAIDRQYALFLSPFGTSRVYLTLNGVIIQGEVILSDSWQVNAWNHLFVTYDGARVTIYLNGKSVYSASASGNITTLASSNFYIGSEPSNFRLNGKIDEVRVYNRSLSADEIDQLYRIAAPTGTDPDLKGYWSFNGPDLVGTAALDRSGANNNGTLTNGPVVTRGKLGQALSFDGTDDFVTIPDAASFHVNTFTVSAWIYSKVAGTAEDDQNVLTYGTSDSYFPLYLSVGGQKVNIYHQGPASWFSGSTTIPLNTWVHIAASWDGTTRKVWVNGVLDGSLADSTATVTGNNIKIGARVDTLNYFNGFIDEVRLYNRALSASEIQALYNQNK